MDSGDERHRAAMMRDLSQGFLCYWVDLTGKARGEKVSGHFFLLSCGVRYPEFVYIMKRSGLGAYGQGDPNLASSLGDLERNTDTTLQDGRP